MTTPPTDAARKAAEMLDQHVYKVVYLCKEDRDKIATSIIQSAITTATADLEQRLAETRQTLMDAGAMVANANRERDEARERVAELERALSECKDALSEYIDGDIENPVALGNALNTARAALRPAKGTP